MDQFKFEQYDKEFNARLTDNNPEFKTNGIHRGYVVDDEDPRDIGRVKIRIPGIFGDNLNNDDLPWAIPALGLYRSGGDNVKPEMSTDMGEEKLKNAFNQTGTGGIFSVPRRGNHVWVFFDEGNHMRPVYLAMAPQESDWLTQKQYVKDIIDSRITQLQEFRSKFTPEDGTIGIDGNDWGDGVHVNARQDITAGGQKAPYEKGGSDQTENTNSGETEIKGKDLYKKRNLNIDNSDEHGSKSKNMDNLTEREWANYPTMDIKPLFDKKEPKVDRGKEPHKYKENYEIDLGEDTQENINRYITSFTTQGGTTIIIDNREEQENFYLIHKNFIENIDQDGSRKIFIGKNEPESSYVRDTTTDDNRNKNPDKDIRSNDELAVSGDKKIHVLGNFVTYTKGNVFTQVDKNMQVDVNDSCGFRVKKGDFDIVIDGLEDETRDEDSEREGGKSKDDEPTQFGDLNVTVRNGHMEIFVKENANIHVGGMANLQIDGEMRTHVKKSAHLYVEGDLCEFIGGNRYTTVLKNVEERFNPHSDGEHTKTEIFGYHYTDVHKDQHLRVGVDGTGNRFKRIFSNEHYEIGSSRYTNITDEEHYTIGKKRRGRLQSSDELIIDDLQRISIGGVADYTIDGELRVKTGGATNFSANEKFIVFGGGKVELNCPKELNIAGATSISDTLSVGSNGAFSGTVYGSDFGAPGLSLVSHKHVQGAGNHFGGGGVTTPGFAGSAPNIPAVSPKTPNAPTEPNNPKEPERAQSAANKGGGIKMEDDPNPINTNFYDLEEVIFIDSDPDIRTQTAKRKHNKQLTGQYRKEKPLDEDPPKVPPPIKPPEPNIIPPANKGPKTGGKPSKKGSSNVKSQDGSTIPPRRERKGKGRF
jgi:hypothetical protein